MVDMQKNILRTATLLIILASLLSACSSSDNSDLTTFMSQTKATAGNQGLIEPLPAYPPYVAVVYASAGLRSPFDPPREVVVAEVRGNLAEAPDLSRPKEYLERFNIGQLSMVGTIEKDGARWALLKDTSNSVHRVTIGSYIGQNYGQIKQVRLTGVDLIEVVTNGQGGWIERPRSLDMSSASQ